MQRLIRNHYFTAPGHKQMMRYSISVSVSPLSLSYLLNLRQTFMVLWEKVLLKNSWDPSPSSDSLISLGFLFFFWLTRSFIALYTEHLSYFSEENKPGTLRTVKLGRCKHCWEDTHSNTEHIGILRRGMLLWKLWKARDVSFMMRGSHWSLLEAGQFVSAPLVGSDVCIVNVLLRKHHLTLSVDFYGLC